MIQNTYLPPGLCVRGVTYNILNRLNNTKWGWRFGSSSSSLRNKRSMILSLCSGRKQVSKKIDKREDMKLSINTAIRRKKNPTTQLSTSLLYSGPSRWKISQLTLMNFHYFVPGASPKLLSKNKIICFSFATWPFTFLFPSTSWIIHIYRHK